MKKFLQISTILFLCLGVLAQKKDGLSSKDEREDDDEDRPTKYASPGRRPSSGGRNYGGRCSCRDLQDQTDALEIRLDRMVETWNDFVDKNRMDGGSPGPVRRPPTGGIGGGRGPYLPGRSMNTSPRSFGGRMEDEGQRRYRF